MVNARPGETPMVFYAHQHLHEDDGDEYEPVPLVRYEYEQGYAGIALTSGTNVNRQYDHQLKLSFPAERRRSPGNNALFVKFPRDVARYTSVTWYARLPSMIPSLTSSRTAAARRWRKRTSVDDLVVWPVAVTKHNHVGFREQRGSERMCVRRIRTPPMFTRTTS